MKILLTGHCSSFFILPWVKAVLDVTDDLRISVLGLNGGGISAADEALFDTIYSPYEVPSLVESKLKMVAMYASEKGWLHTLKQAFNPKKFRSTVIEHEYKKRKAAWYKGLTEAYEQVFVHYLSPANLSIIAFIPAKTKLILCFWGSDLMQESSKETWLALKEGLQRADIIMVQNHGMRFICCIKYGWDLLPKIRIAPYVPNENIIQGIEQYSKASAKEKIGNLWSIPTNKIWLSCGHRPLPMFQQVSLINVLSQLTPKEKDSLVLVITMNYSTGNKAYIEQTLAAAQASGIPYFVIDRYLEDDELAALRKGVDIFINFPRTDAMSTTMVEHLYAGNFVITNRSLPYNLFRKCQLEYSEIDEASEILPLVQQSLQEQHFSNISNKKKVEQMLAEDYHINHWLTVIYE